MGNIFAENNGKNDNEGGGGGGNNSKNDRDGGNGDNNTADAENLAMKNEVQVLLFDHFDKS